MAVPAAGRSAVRHLPEPVHQVTAFGFAVCRTDDGSMVGVLNISPARPGSYQRGLLGYGTFTGNARQGYMIEALTLALDFAFSALGLHRLEAEIQPGNAASLALVKRLGFLREGLAPELIKIEGVWRDHERWSITKTMYSRP